ncbi:MAG: PLD nuclease N-terminal domain-containing protein [Litoreibacter sp.]
MLMWIFGIVSFGLSIWAIVSILNSKETSGLKAIWIVVVIAFPTVGFIVWYLAGPKSALKM